MVSFGNGSSMMIFLVGYDEKGEENNASAVIAI